MKYTFTLLIALLLAPLISLQGRSGDRQCVFDCTVRNVSISGVRTKDSQTDLTFEQVVKVIELKPNPAYPKTTPKGGTGKGNIFR
jgi:hypothetical protein